MNANKDLFDDIEETEQASMDNDFHLNTDKMDDILELTDVVLEGEMASQSSEDSVFLAPEELDDILIKVGENGMPVEKPIESAPEEELEELPEADPEDTPSALESSDFQFEDSQPPEEDHTDLFPETPQENWDDVLSGLEEKGTEAEKPEENLPAGLEKAAEIERPDDVLARLGGQNETDEKPEESSVSHDIPGISEEKLKEMLTEIIQETVDKAIRETFSEVAEKVIREAIEGLKEIIDSSGE